MNRRWQRHAEEYFRAELETHPLYEYQPDHGRCGTGDGKRGSPANATSQARNRRKKDPAGALPPLFLQRKDVENRRLQSLSNRRYTCKARP